MMGTTRLMGPAHARFVHARRVRKLAEAIAPLLQPGWTVFDVGCGDGRLAGSIQERRAGLSFEGFELEVRGETAIPVREFDGRRLPAADGAADAVLLIDVLHHTRDPTVLLAEARRVARRAIVIKDHRTARPLARPLLRFMDRVGNGSRTAPLSVDYWSEARWRQAWEDEGLRVRHYRTRLDLYAGPARWLFESGLHFLVELVPRAQPRGPLLPVETALLP